MTESSGKGMEEKLSLLVKEVATNVTEQVKAVKSYTFGVLGNFHTAIESNISNVGDAVQEILPIVRTIEKGIDMVGIAGQAGDDVRIAGLDCASRAPQRDDA